MWETESVFQCKRTGTNQQRKAAEGGDREKDTFSLTIVGKQSGAVER